MLSTSPFSKRDRIRAYTAHDQMPAIYDLLGLGSALSCSTLIVFGPVSADDFHARMVPEPLGKGFRATVFQQIDWLVRLALSYSRRIVP